MDNNLKDTQEHLKELVQKKYLHFDFPMRDKKKRKLLIEFYKKLIIIDIYLSFELILFTQNILVKNGYVIK